LLSAAGDDFRLPHARWAAPFFGKSADFPQGPKLKSSFRQTIVNSDRRTNMVRKPDLIHIVRLT